MSHIKSNNAMDGFDLSRSPPEFQEWSTIIWMCHTYTIVTWAYVYCAMIYLSIKERTFGMPLISQCVDIAWEIVFGIYFAYDNWIISASFFFTVIVDSTVTWAAVKYGAPEWDRSPMIQRNLGLIYVGGIAIGIAGHIAGVKELGAIAALFVNAIVCQAILSVGYLAQLLVRGSTRGFSLGLWFLRFSGSLTLVPEFYLRVKYWPEGFGFLGRPFMLWCCAVYLGFDLAYGICFWYIRKHEQELAQQAKLKGK